MIVVLLSTSMFVGGVVGFLLDNTVPGNVYITLYMEYIIRPKTRSKQVRDGAVFPFSDHRQE